MKKIFGWLFILIGLGNFLKVFAMVLYGVVESGGQSIESIFCYAIGFFGLGIWMITSSKKKNNNLPST
ncbi:MAG: hypothetical protein ACRC3G_00940 [Bacteroidales bacterium]